MNMSEKEWANLAAERGLDPTTGKRPELPMQVTVVPDSAWEPQDVAKTLSRLGEIAGELRTLQIIMGVGFAALAAIQILLR